MAQPPLSNINLDFRLIVFSESRLDAERFADNAPSVGRVEAQEFSERSLEALRDAITDQTVQVVLVAGDHDADHEADRPRLRSVDVRTTELVTGQQVLNEILDLITRRLPQLAADDPARPGLAAFAPALGAALGRPPAVAVAESPPA